MYRKGVLVVVLFLVSILFAHNSLAQAAVQIIHSDVIAVKPRKPIQFDTGRNFVDNTSKKKKVKAKIHLTHGDCCPSFMAYTSKARDKRMKRIQKRK